MEDNFVKCSGVGAIFNERLRQINEEGWNSEHDDAHTNGEMAYAAACYAISGGHKEEDRGTDDTLMAAIQFVWPDSWSFSWWKPKSRREDLIRAGALIAAEIDRLDREDV